MPGEAPADLGRLHDLEVQLELQEMEKRREGRWPTIAELGAQVPPELRERWERALKLTWQPKEKRNA